MVSPFFIALIACVESYESYVVEDFGPSKCSQPNTMDLRPIVPKRHTQTVNDSLFQDMRRISELSSSFVTYSEEISDNDTSSIVAATKYLSIYSWFDQLYRISDHYDGTGIMIGEYKMLTARHNVEGMEFLYVCDSPSSFHINCTYITQPRIVYFSDDMDIVGIDLPKTLPPQTHFIEVKKDDCKSLKVGDQIYISGFSTIFIDQDYVFGHYKYGKKQENNVLPQISSGYILSDLGSIRYVIEWWNKLHLMEQSISNSDFSLKTIKKTQLRHSALILNGMSGGGVFRIGNNNKIKICGIQSFEEATIMINIKGNQTETISPNVVTLLNHSNIQQWIEAS